MQVSRRPSGFAPLVVVAIELLEIALVGAVLKDDERRVPQLQLLLPVGAVLVLPVDGHRGMGTERVVNDERRTGGRGQMIFACELFGRARLHEQETPAAIGRVLPAECNGADDVSESHGD